MEFWRWNVKFPVLNVVQISLKYPDIRRRHLLLKVWETVIVKSKHLQNSIRLAVRCRWTEVWRGWPPSHLLLSNFTELSWITFVTGIKEARTRAVFVMQSDGNQVSLLGGSSVRGTQFSLPQLYLKFPKNFSVNVTIISWIILSKSFPVNPLPTTMKFSTIQTVSLDKISVCDRSIYL